MCQLFHKELLTIPNSVQTRFSFLYLLILGEMSYNNKNWKIKIFSRYLNVLLNTLYSNECKTTLALNEQSQKCTYLPTINSNKKCLGDEQSRLLLVMLQGLHGKQKPKGTWECRLTCHLTNTYLHLTVSICSKYATLCLITSLVLLYGYRNTLQYCGIKYYGWDNPSTPVVNSHKQILHLLTVVDESRFKTL